MVAEVHVLFEGYVGSRVAGTVSLLRDGDVVAIVDPGMVPDRSAILEPLAALGLDPGDVTDVILSHHHPDHTVNIALFPQVPVHDYWAVYDGDRWTDRPAEGARLGDGITFLETPGHTREDMTTLVETAQGTVALTHLWWNKAIEGDPRAWSLERLREHRRRVLDVAVRIVPGHGPAFDVDDTVPR